jgi:hypothetical protein
VEAVPKKTAVGSWIVASFLGVFMKMGLSKEPLMGKSEEVKAT